MNAEYRSEKFNFSIFLSKTLMYFLTKYVNEMKKKTEKLGIDST